MTRLLLVATLLTLVGLAAMTLTLTLSEGATARSFEPQQVTMRVGDTMVVEDTDLGCQVRSRNQRVVIECRRLDEVAGTYMTLISERRAKVARFRSADTAKVILTARHGGGWRACGVAPRAARAGGRGCR